MAKLLLLGDIHANYPALEAIAGHIRAERFDWIVNTGDFTVYGTFPNETIQWFRQRANAVCIYGNTDRKVLKILAGKRPKKPRKAEKRVMYTWTAEALLAENIAFLKSLGRQAQLEVGGFNIGIFHGTKDDPDEELFPDAPRSRFRSLAKGSPFHVHIMGHSHVPFYKVVDGVHFINPGSAGRMFDGDPRASFATLTLAAGNLAVDHYRIPYAVDAVIADIHKHKLPAIYARMYRLGKKLN